MLSDQPHYVHSTAHALSPIPGALITRGKSLGHCHLATLPCVGLRKAPFIDSERADKRILNLSTAPRTQWTRSPQPRTRARWSRSPQLPGTPVVRALSKRPHRSAGPVVAARARGPVTLAADIGTALVLGKINGQLMLPSHCPRFLKAHPKH